MKNLRLLQINSVHLKGPYKHLSQELKWLCWHKCPLKFLPQSLHLENLVILDMQNSNVKQVWKKKKIFNELKVLNLSNSIYLTKSPDFSQVEQLEILVLEGCTSLVKVHESIGYLKKLVLLNLERCKNLRNLPSSISNLENLETLILSQCFKLEKLPEQLRSMMALTMLKLENTAIKQLPSSFSLLVNLETLSLLGCECLNKSPEFSPTSQLKMLILAGCRSLVEVHKSIGLLKRLHFLDLAGCKKLKNLPSSISNLERLETLSLHGCECLIKSPEFLQTSSLKMLILAGCTSLVEVHKSIRLLKRLVHLDLGGCKKLMNLPSNISNLQRLETLLLSDCLHEFSTFNVVLSDWMFTQFQILDRNRAVIMQQQSSSSSLWTNSLYGCRGASSSCISPRSSNLISVLPFISELCSMTWIIELDLSGRNLCENDFPTEFGCLSSLQKLDLSRNNFRNLPDCIGHLPSLYKLCLNECTNLQSISVLIGLQCLEANGCTFLESLSFNNCHKLAVPSWRRRYGYLLMGRCNNLLPAFRESVLQMTCKADFGYFIYLPGSEIPNWISHPTILMDSAISFRAPSYWGPRKYCKLLVWVVFAANEEAPRDSHLGEDFFWIFRNKTRSPSSSHWLSSNAIGPGSSHTWSYNAIFFDSFEDHIVVEVTEFPGDLNIVKSGDEIEVKVASLPRLFNNGRLLVKKCGIHVVEEQDVIDEDESASLQEMRSDPSANREHKSLQTCVVQDTFTFNVSDWVSLVNKDGPSLPKSSPVLERPIWKKRVNNPFICCCKGYGSNQKIRRERKKDLPPERKERK